MAEKLFQGRRAVGLLDAGGTANRLMETITGTTMIVGRATAGMAPTGLFSRSATLVVAASDATVETRAMADYVCDGIADNVEINAALTALGSAGGTVQLSEGTFTLAAQVITKNARQVIRGVGMGATVVRAMAGIGSGINTATALVHIGHDDCEIADLLVDVNRSGGDNSSWTSARGVGTDQGVAVVRPIIRRVAVLDSPGFGIVVYACTNGVVRNCLVINSFNHAYYLQGTTGQPLVVQGCTAYSNGGYGMVLDGGPVSISDCASLYNSGDGFITSNVAPVTFRNCYAQNNVVGFRLNANNNVLIGCRATGNTGRGFHVAATRTRLYGCVSDGGGEGFMTEAPATETMMVGCIGRGGTATAFYHTAGTALYAGCQSIGYAQNGFRGAAGTVTIQECVVVGTSASNNGIWLSGGTDHSVTHCRITTNGASGISISGSPNIPNNLIADNMIGDSSLKSTNFWDHIDLYVGTINSHVAGNSFENASSGNWAGRSVWLESQAGSNNFIGRNDYFKGYSNLPVLDAAVGNNTRFAAKVQLDYARNADVFNGAGTPSGIISAATWYDLCADQNFRVDSPNSTIEITVRGNMLLGATSSIAVMFVDVLVDGGARQRRSMCEHQEANNWQNPFSDGLNWKMTGLSVGTHTVRARFYMTQAGQAYLRGASAVVDGTPFENLHIQVTEYVG